VGFSLGFEFLTLFNWPWAPNQWATALAQNVLETRRSPASLEPLIDLLGCLEPELWSKTPFCTKFQKAQE